MWFIRIKDIMKKRVIGIAIGGTKTAVVTAYFDGGLSNLNKTILKTDSNNVIKEMENICNILDKEEKIDFISVVSGGPLDSQQGIIINPPHLPGFVNFPIVKLLKEKYKCPVTLLNDADACALAEYKFGPYKDDKNLAYITFGTGFGAGLILNGELYLGHNGMAGEIGHVRLENKGPVGYGKVGSIEAFCAGGNIPLWAKEYIGNKKTFLNKYQTLTTKDIADAANNGDLIAKEIFNELARYLARSISILIDILNLDVVVIGGIYPRCENLLKEEMFNELKEECISNNLEVCRIVASYLKENIDDYSSLMGLYLKDSHLE